MRILIFNELYTPNKKGGAEVSTQLLAESLVELGHEIHICTSSNKNSDEIINGVVIHRRKQHNIYWSFYHDSICLLYTSDAADDSLRVYIDENNIIFIGLFITIVCLFGRKRFGILLKCIIYLDIGQLGISFIWWHPMLFILMCLLVFPLLYGELQKSIKYLLFIL